MADPRLFVNRPCVYERQLPGGAYITAHVERLQHGFYSSASVADMDAENVDFLAINFVFHPSHTLSHRFKSATIRASVRGSQEMRTSEMLPHGNPRFLMHAPHLIFGTVSPENMQWSFSLAGSLGISEAPVTASLIPSGSLSRHFRRYEMMRIQGSSRTLKSALGPEYDVESGEIVWSLEENTLQRSGLPREFTFVMLVHKPTADADIKLNLDINPVLDAWFGSYPKMLLSLAKYQPQDRRGVNFRREVGQRFEPVDKAGGFNFAALESSFDHYIAMPGRKFTRSVTIPSDNSASQNNSLAGNNNNTNNNFQQGLNTQYGNGQYASGGYNHWNPTQQLGNGLFSVRQNLEVGLTPSRVRSNQTNRTQIEPTASTINTGTSSVVPAQRPNPPLRSTVEAYSATSPRLLRRVRKLYNLHTLRSPPAAHPAFGHDVDDVYFVVAHLESLDRDRAGVIGGKVYEEEEVFEMSSAPRRQRSASLSEAHSMPVGWLTDRNLEEFVPDWPFLRG
ncbi:hypothetical protein N7466_003374 [Penicillium verhagenii]|uniref:uncharacterized protein n=1 Tax=Penicillium verhagenii TaxID=1562060 RepID=UPI002545BB02|nr:uncharacterized protein N7466_003374 [Penicillium verhagenii]KAJ5936924.1 hypothetical protein N7466_003374 [Penicillium verhagenii]